MAESEALFLKQTSKFEIFPFRNGVTRTRCFVWLSFTSWNSFSVNRLATDGKTFIPHFTFAHLVFFNFTVIGVKNKNFFFKSKSFNSNLKCLNRFHRVTIYQMLNQDSALLLIITRLLLIITRLLLLILYFSANLKERHFTLNNIQTSGCKYMELAESQFFIRRF